LIVLEIFCPLSWITELELKPSPDTVV